MQRVLKQNAFDAVKSARDWHLHGKLMCYASWKNADGFLSPGACLAPSFGGDKTKASLWLNDNLPDAAKEYHNEDYSYACAIDLGEGEAVADAMETLFSNIYRVPAVETHPVVSGGLSRTNRNYMQRIEPPNDTNRKGPTENAAPCDVTNTDTNNHRRFSSRQNNFDTQKSCSERIR